MSCKIFFGGRIGILFSPNTRRRSRKRSFRVPPLLTICGRCPVDKARQTSSSVTATSSISSSGDSPLVKSTCSPKLSPSSPPIAPKKFKSLGSYSRLPTWVFVKAKGVGSCSRSGVSRERSGGVSPNSDPCMSVEGLGDQPDHLDMSLPLDTLEFERWCLITDGTWRTFLDQGLELCNERSKTDVSVLNPTCHQAEARVIEKREDRSIQRLSLHGVLQFPGS